MHFKIMSDYDSHKNYCDNVYGGKLFLPRSSHDLDLMKYYINNLTIEYVQVAGLDECDQYWIPLKKQVDGNWVIDGQAGTRETDDAFLPFAPGEPNGGNLQTCAAAVKLGQEQPKYFDQDCKKNFACSVCMIPWTTLFTLRGIDHHDKHSHIDNVYWLNTFYFYWKGIVVFIGMTQSMIVYNLDSGIFEVINLDNCQVMITAKSTQLYGSINHT